MRGLEQKICFRNMCCIKNIFFQIQYCLTSTMFSFRWLLFKLILSQQEIQVIGDEIVGIWMTYECISRMHFFQLNFRAFLLY